MEILGIFTKSFFIKNTYCNLKLSIVALSRALSKRYGLTKIIKILHITRDTRKSLEERRRSVKNKKGQGKFKNVTMTIKFCTFIYFFMEKDIFSSKT